MQKNTVQLKNKLGLHARAASSLVQLATKFKSSIRIIKDDNEVDGKSILGILTLAAECGSTLKIITDGPDEQEATQKLLELIEDKFHEEQ